VDRGFLFHNASRVLLRTGLCVSFDQAYLFDDNAIGFGKHLQHFPDLAFVVARYDLYRVVFYNVHHGRTPFPTVSILYMTSGASEMIFMNFFSRSSRATGPNMRVPTGSLASLMITAAFSSNRI
jgi:hypothetical protein